MAYYFVYFNFLIFGIRGFSKKRKKKKNGIRIFNKFLEPGSHIPVIIIMYGFNKCVLGPMLCENTIKNELDNYCLLLFPSMS